MAGSRLMGRKFFSGPFFFGGGFCSGISAALPVSTSMCFVKMLFSMSASLLCAVYGAFLTSSIGMFAYPLLFDIVVVVFVISVPVMGLFNGFGGPTCLSMTVSPSL